MTESEDYFERHEALGDALYEEHVDEADEDES